MFHCNKTRIKNNKHKKTVTYTDRYHNSVQDMSLSQKIYGAPHIQDHYLFYIVMIKKPVHLTIRSNFHCNLKLSFIPQKAQLDSVAINRLQNKHTYTVPGLEI
jgi:hypothetical protein